MVYLHLFCCIQARCRLVPCINPLGDLWKNHWCKDFGALFGAAEKLDEGQCKREGCSWFCTMTSGAIMNGQQHFNDTWSSTAGSSVTVTFPVKRATNLVTRDPEMTTGSPLYSKSVWWWATSVWIIWSHWCARTLIELVFDTRVGRDALRR